MLISTLPFIFLLLTIAIAPMIAPKWWHRYDGHVVVFWIVAWMIPTWMQQGWGEVIHAVWHVVMSEYIPFVVLLLALYTLSGGIVIRGNLHGSPLLNTGLLAFGTVLASFMGTTGASMLLIRPLIRANDNRQHRTHVFVFFIFLVSNVGGALTPLGDPPLFLGFLAGVAFTWTLQHLWMPTLVLSITLLVVFYSLDSYYYHRREELTSFDPTPDTEQFRVEGMFNLVLLLGVVGLVLMSGLWRTAPVWQWGGVSVSLANLLRDLGLLGLTAWTWWGTEKRIHQLNEFNWEPMQEVAKLFIGIFITITPVITLLKMGQAGPFAPLLQSLQTPQGHADALMYFWMTGILSAFLDNAPTYLVFFNTAGGDASVLMTSSAKILMAISAGAVFCGAMTYIGNAPNLMVKAIATHQGVRMPSFFGYMLWSGGILLPLLIGVSWWLFGL